MKRYDRVGTIYDWEECKQFIRDNHTALDRSLTAALKQDLSFEEFLDTYRPFLYQVSEAQDNLLEYMYKTGIFAPLAHHPSMQGSHYMCGALDEMIEERSNYLVAPTVEELESLAADPQGDILYACYAKGRKHVQQRRLRSIKTTLDIALEQHKRTQNSMTDYVITEPHHRWFIAGLQHAAVKTMTAAAGGTRRIA